MEDVLQEGNNIVSKPKKKKYIFSLIIIGIILLVSIGGFLFYQHQQKKMKEEYAMNMALTTAKISFDFYTISYIVALNSDIWDNAIDNHVDFSNAVNKFLESISKEESIVELKDNQNKLRDSMKLLQNPPEEYEESYYILKDMYGVYTKMYEQAFSPTGSLIEYNRKTNEYFSEYEKLQEELFITLPTDVKKLEEEYEEELKKENKDTELEGQ